MNIIRIKITTILVSILFSVQTGYARRASFFIGDAGRHAELDAVNGSLLDALRLKEPHIFVTYQTWKSFLALRNQTIASCRAYGVNGDPLSQLYIEGQNVFFTPTRKQFEERKLASTLSNLKKNLTPVKDISPYAMTTLMYFNPQEWQLYDTKKGLYYLKHQSSSAAGVNVSSFVYIPNADTAHNQGENNTWTKQLTSLLVPSAGPWNLHIVGHGTDARFTYSIPEVAGIPEATFAPILKTCNSDLPTHNMGISSCFTYPSRILAIAQKYCGLQHLSFNVITLVDTDREALVYLPRPPARYTPSWFGKDQSEPLKGGANSTIDIIRQLDSSGAANKNVIMQALRKLATTHANYTNIPSVLYAQSNLIQHA